MTDEKIEQVARAVCYGAIKVSLGDNDEVRRKGCPSDLACKKAGVCLERPEILRCSTYYQTALAIVAIL